MRQAVFLIVACGLLGCAGSAAWHSQRISSTRSEADRNNANLMTVEIGMPKKEMLDIMGTPTSREAYSVGEGDVVEFYMYRTTGLTSTYDEEVPSDFTPVAIKNGTVVGWGRNYYEQVVRSAVDVTIN